MTEQEKIDDVVFDGIRLLESMARYYGSERAIAVWDAMGDAMGAELKQQVFYAMLTGDTSNRMRVSRGTCTDAVGAIKAIRMATGLGLKEAKDIWDLSKIRTVTVENVQRDERSALTRSLRDLGMRIH